MAASRQLLIFSVTASWQPGVAIRRHASVAARDRQCWASVSQTVSGGRRADNVRWASGRQCRVGIGPTVSGRVSDRIIVPRGAVHGWRFATARLARQCRTEAGSITRRPRSEIAIIHHRCSGAPPVAGWRAQWHVSRSAAVLRRRVHPLLNSAGVRAGV